MVTCLKSSFGFRKKIADIIHFYEETLEKVGWLYLSVYVTAVSLANELDIEEKYQNRVNGR